MRRLVTAAVALGCVLAAPSPAAAKVVGTARIEGLGVNRAVVVDHGEAFAFPELAGLFGDRRNATSEPAELGPRYTMTFELEWPHGWETVQYLYPFSSDGPVVYTPPGQRLFHGQNGKVDPGWAEARPGLVTLLEERGLPREDPAAEEVDPIALTTGADGVVGIPWALLALGGLLLGVAAVARRGVQTAPSRRA